MALNARTNALIDAEIGQDDGTEYGGDRSVFNTL